MMSQNGNNSLVTVHPLSRISFFSGHPRDRETNARFNAINLALSYLLVRKLGPKSKRFFLKVVLLKASALVFYACMLTTDLFKRARFISISRQIEGRMTKGG